MIQVSPLSSTIERTQSAPGTEFWALSDSKGAVSFYSFFEGLKCDRSMATLLLDAWASTPFSSFVWELPALTIDNFDAAFECAVIEERALDRRRASPAAFGEHLDVATGACVFPNLGRDAVLVAPSLRVPQETCCHLAEFSRHAPRPRAHEVLIALASTVLQRIDTRPLWISTSGLGVPWLHFRLDLRPKYYQCSRYRAT